MLDSNDVKSSAKAAWKARISNNGQACNSNKRIIVMDDIYDEFVAELTNQATGLQPGDPAEDNRGTFAPSLLVPQQKLWPSRYGTLLERGPFYTRVADSQTDPERTLHRLCSPESRRT
ncbi:succinate-semialdehyde dehydrogenase [NADP(+)] [Arthrobacter sp. Hiyo4]|nr:succinate-semialdehyde dehydrogenase [NADP(+)] [Arthrobacter sp. Hiyo4]